MRDAALNARKFVDGLTRDNVLLDERTQQAVQMSLFIIGEVATTILVKHAAFAEVHPDIEWQQMRALRNRIVHGYFDIDLEIVWDTVTTSRPKLLRDLESLSPNPTKP